MQEVALKAGVSKGTVSKALNRSWNISPTLRQKVLKTCEEMGYRMDCNFQDLIHKSKNGATRDIGFIIVGVDFSDLAYVQLLDGVVRGAEENHLRLSLIKLSGREKMVFDLPPVLRDRRVSGVIVSGMITPETIALLKKLELPYVIIGNYSEDVLGHGSSVELDISYTLYHLVDALKKNGRERIGYYYETPDSFFYLQCRKSLASAINQHDLPFHEGLFYAGNGKYYGLSEAIKNDLRSSVPPFDSIVCMNHRTALDLSHLILLESPKKKTTNIVLGILRSYPHEKLPVPTIYINANFDRLASQGVKLLSDHLENRDTEPKRLLIKPEVELELENSLSK